MDTQMPSPYELPGTSQTLNDALALVTELASDVSVDEIGERLAAWEICWIGEQNIAYNAMGRHAISIEDIKTIMAAKNIKPRQGDILILRTVYAAQYMGLSTTVKEVLKTASHSWPGLKQDESMVRWLWERQFAAIATDNPGLECVPPVDEDWQLHSVLLAGWGIPIVELFDLEALAEVCKRRERWAFFLTTVPLNYSGVVASPPNAMALL